VTDVKRGGGPTFVCESLISSPECSFDLSSLLDSVGRAGQALLQLE
jgi:hypothetical protein